MAPTLGKRKRVSREQLEQSSRSPPRSSDTDDASAEDLQAIFRRAFEAKFKPLASEPKKTKIEHIRVQEDDDAEVEEVSDWSGISDDDDNEATVEIVDYTDPKQHEADHVQRAELKAFMSSKPPTSTTTTSAQTSSLSAKKTQNDAADPTETNLVKNDLALQKLLRESHLLSASSRGPASSSSTPGQLATTGIARHKSADLHLQALGAKGSVFAQKKMPMAQRKHMVAKARLGEEKRRAEARDAGVVLEREKRVGKGGGDKRRDKGVGAPIVGRFKGGTLNLSKRDVMSITGRPGGGKGKGKATGKKGRS